MMFQAAPSVLTPSHLQSNGHVARTLDATIAVGICLLLAFGPLAFGATEDWAIFILEEGAALLLVIWALRSLTGTRLELSRSPLYLPMLLFAALIAVQLLFDRTAYWYATWQKAMLWAAYAILFFLAAQSFRRESWLKRFSLACTVFGLGLAMFAILQKFAGNGKIYWLVPNQAAAEFFGPYMNHSHYAGLMEMLVPFPLVLAMAGYSSFPARVLCSFAGVIMGSSILLSQSRGGVIAFVIELGVLTVLAAQRRPKRRQLALLASFCLLLFFCFLLVRPHGLWDRFMLLSGHGHKVQDEHRLAMAEDSLHMVRARPLLGWGFGNFAAVYPSFRSFYTDLNVNAAHNDFLELTAETGLAGLALVIAFLYLLYGRGIRNARYWRRSPRASTALAALVGCTGLVAHSFSDFNLQVPANAAWFFVLAAIATGAVAQSAREGSRW